MPKILKTYSYAVFAVGMAALLFITPGIHTDFFLITVLLAAMASVLDKYCVELPNGRIFAGSSIFTFTTLVCFGLPEALIVEMVVALSVVIFERTQWIKVLFNVGQYLISIAAAGLAFLWLGGTPGGLNWNNIVYLMIAMAIYNIINLCLLSVILATLYQRNYFAIWIESSKDVVFIYIVTLIFSLRLAFTYNQSQLTQFWIEAFFIFIIFIALRYAFGLFISLRKTYLHSMESLTYLTEDKLSISVGHATRTGRLARQIAEQLKLPQEEIDAIHYAALFHDIGKGQINEKIFQKKGPLTLEEEKEYRKHVVIGADMIKEISGLEKAAEYVRYHHERWDGGGFPQGLRGEKIPLGARIIKAANEYDHIVYKKKKENPAEDFKQLANNKLDPKLVDLVMSIADFTEDSEQTYLETAFQDRVLENVVLNEARNKFYESALLKKFGASIIATYDGTYRDGQGMTIEIPCESQITSLVQRARDQQIRVREYIEDPQTGKVYDLYCVPTGNHVNLMLFDVSNILEYEVKQEERIKKLYKDVIYSVTQGKLLLAEEAEIEGIYHSELVAEAPIRTKVDVSQCRALVQKVLSGLNVPQKQIFDILLCTSEAATNVLKHATDGQMKVFLDQHQHTLRVVIKDNGSGIDLIELPKTTLMAGYSTKVSMGHGFSLILKLIDRMILNTGPQGTTIVMEVKLSAVEQRLNQSADLVV